MSKVGGPGASRAGGPGIAVVRGIHAFVRSIPIGAIMVQQQVYFLGICIVPVRRRPLDTALDDSVTATGSRPAPKQTRRRDLNKDGLLCLVLHEAQKVVLRWTGRVVEGKEVQIDYVGRCLVDECLRGRKGLEVGRVGISDADVGRRAGVTRIGGGIKLGGPMNKILAYIDG